MSFAVGSLVRARGREWVVLPESQDDLVLVRPLGGTDDEATGICPALEPIQPAQFDLPDAASLGDWRSCRLLRDAVRLGFRASAGPFRSFANLGVEPRPYQLVPLLVGLKQDPVRLLVADDVGTPEEADQIGHRTVLDLVNDEPDEGMDVTPGAQFETESPEDSEAAKTRRRLLDLAREAEALRGKDDSKLVSEEQLYHSVLRFLHELEMVYARGRKPSFQYILTTTSTPPEEVNVQPFVRLRLDARRDKDLLLGVRF